LEVHPEYYPPAVKTAYSMAAASLNNPDTHFSTCLEYLIKVLGYIDQKKYTWKRLKF
jgi:hypothetical protein